MVITVAKCFKIKYNLIFPNLNIKNFMNEIKQHFQEYHHEYVGKIIGQSFNYALESYGLETIIGYNIEEKRQKILDELIRSIIKGFDDE